VGDVISRVGLGLLAQVIRLWAPTARGKYFAKGFSGN